MSDKLGPIQYEGGNQVFVGRDYGQTKSYSEQFAYEIDDEVRKIVNDGHDKAREIIESHRDKHKLIAEKLLEYETLDAKAIKSLFESGEMPKSYEEESEFPSENGRSYEDAKRALEKKEEQGRVNDKEEDSTAAKEDNSQESNESSSEEQDDHSDKTDE